MTRIRDAVGTIVDKNSRVAIWERDKDDPHCSDLVWDGMAWDIPEEYLNRGDWKIIGIMAEDLWDSDIVNIVIGVKNNETRN